MSEGHLSDLALDNIVAKARDPKGIGQDLEAHLVGCEQCRLRLERFEQARVDTAQTVERLLAFASSADLKAEYALNDTSQSGHPNQPDQPGHVGGPERLDWMSRMSSKPWFFQPGTWVAALLMVLVSRPWLPQSAEHSGTLPVPGVHGVRAKGSVVRFVVQRAGHIEPGVSGGLFRAQDALRFLISTGQPRHFFLIGIESVSGKISPYHPFGGARSVLVSSGSDMPLPGSLILDDAKGQEFFLGIFSKDPLRFDDIRASIEASRGAEYTLEALRKVALPGEHHWIVVKKEE